MQNTKADAYSRAVQEDAERAQVDDEAWGHSHDSREKLEADAREFHDNILGHGFDDLISMLDRQAAITEREVKVKNKANWALWCKELGIECTTESAGEQFRQMDGRIRELEAERDHWMRVASEHAEKLRKMWLKDADGEPLHIGETRYGADGTEWRVTGFRWGSSHPVQGVDGEGRRRNLKPSWLSSRTPLEWLLHELRSKGDGVTMTRADWEHLADRIAELKRVDA